MTESQDAGKSPAFQFYPNDFLADANVVVMSLQERGAYITLLCLCWQQGTLPSDTDRLARLCGVPVTAFRKLWPAIAPCFRAGVEPERLIQPRLEREREKQAAYKRRQSDASNKRWDKRGISQTDAVASSGGLPARECSSSSSSSSSLSSDFVKKKESSEALTRSEPAVLTFPVIGSEKQTWALTERQVTEWERLFPGVPVLAECRKALAWVQANQRKTAKGMPKFLTAWLTRAVDSPRSASQAGGMGTRTIALVNATAGFLAGGK